MDVVEQRILNLKKDILDEYERIKTLHKIIDAELVQETDGTFVKVYIRNLLEKMWFTERNYFPAFSAIGGSIARGEVNHLVYKLEEVIESHTIDPSIITKDWIIRRVGELGGSFFDIVMLVPYGNFYTRLLTDQNYNVNYDYDKKMYYINIDGYRLGLFGIYKDESNSDIIIMKKDSCQLSYRLYSYNYRSDPGTLYTNIEQSSNNPEKMDLLSYSTIKIHLLNVSGIKRYSFIELDENLSIQN